MAREVSALLRSAYKTQAALLKLADALDRNYEAERTMRIVGNSACLIGAGLAAIGTFVTGGAALPFLAGYGMGASLSGASVNIGAIVGSKIVQTAIFITAARLWDEFINEVCKSEILTPLRAEIRADFASLTRNASTIKGVLNVLDALDDTAVAAKDILKNLPILKLAFVGLTLHELINLVVDKDSKGPGKHIRDLANGIEKLISTFS